MDENIPYVYAYPDNIEIIEIYLQRCECLLRSCIDNSISFLKTFDSKPFLINVQEFSNLVLPKIYFGIHKIIVNRLHNIHKLMDLYSMYIETGNSIKLYDTSTKVIEACNGIVVGFFALIKLIYENHSDIDYIGLIEKKYPRMYIYFDSNS